MSFFSDYLTTIKDMRGLSCAQIAKMCNKDTSVVFSWLTGKRIPKNWEQVEQVIDKLHLSEEEYIMLQEHYIRVKLGEEEYEAHKLIMKCFEVMKQRSAEYKSNQQVIIKSDVRELNMPETIYLNNKMELLSCLQNCLDYLACQEEKNLYLDFHMMHPDMLIIIKMFLNKVRDCNIKEIVYLIEDNPGAKVQNLKTFTGILETMIQKNPIEIFCRKENEYEKEISENRIISDEFIFVFNENFSYGVVSRNREFIKYHKDMYEKAMDSSDNLGKRNYEAVEFAYQYPMNFVSGSSYEYMQCVGNCMTQKILEDHIYDEVPGKEELIKGLLIGNVFNNAEWEWKSIFSYEGFIEFMETGRINNFPYAIYRTPDLDVRCELVENALGLIRGGLFNYHMIKSDRMYNMKDYYFEELNGEKLSVNIYLEEGLIERFSIKNSVFAGYFADFYTYLEKIGYIHGVKQTYEIMQKVLEEYRMR